MSEDWRRPMPLLGDHCLIIPISTLDQTNHDAPLLLPCPRDDLAQIIFATAQIRLHRQTASWALTLDPSPIRWERRTELRLGKNAFKNPQCEVLQHEAFHIEVDERASVFGQAKNRTQPGRDAF